MASILLKKEHNGSRAGTVISVPFSQGLNLIAAGIGERLEDLRPKPDAPIVDIGSLKNQIRDLSYQIKQRDAQIAKHVDTATEQTADLNEAKKTIQAKDAELAAVKADLNALLTGKAEEKPAEKTVEKAADKPADPKAADAKKK